MTIYIKYIHEQMFHYILINYFKFIVADKSTCKYKNPLFCANGPRYHLKCVIKITYFMYCPPLSSGFTNLIRKSRHVFFVLLFDIVT